jgi:hypothetical protein
MVEQRKRQIRRCDGCFYGFRINCERIPILAGLGCALGVGRPSADSVPACME